jgi:putative mycofactocin binding protein MftB
LTRATEDASDPEYLVPEWVRVRRESFGLLFYDTRSTRLTFVRSGDSLVAPPFTGPRRLLGVDRREGTEPGLSRLLEDLEAKGLLVAAKTE